MTTIEITHQIEKTKQRFRVKDPKKLTKEEVELICEKLNVKALFVEGKFYSL